MKRTCEACGDRKTDGYVCRPCALTYERHIAETPWLVDELGRVLARQTRYGDTGGGGRKGRERPLPVDLRATDALDRYRKALRTVADRLDPKHGNRGALALARHLLDHVDTIRFRPDGAELVQLVDDAFKHARYVVDRPAERWYAGPCVQCERDLYARPGAAVVTCRDCTLTYDVASRRTYLLDEAEDQIVNAITVARAVTWLGAEPLTAARVRKWAERGRLVAKAIDRCDDHRLELNPPKCRRCQPRYRIGDAIDLLASDTTKNEREKGKP